MRICFLSLNSYPALTGKNLGYSGGAEFQQVQLARELVKMGQDVCFVTYRHGSRETEIVSRIEVTKAYGRDESSELNPIVKYCSLLSCLKKVNADVYLHSAGSSGVLPFFCYLKRKKYIFRVPSDALVLGKALPGAYGFFERTLCTIELKKANAVVSQSAFQEYVLKERFHVASSVIKNGISITGKSCKKTSPPSVLWVGSISRGKRPEIFIELARSFPDVKFEIIGGKTEDLNLLKTVEHAARSLDNFEYRGYIPTGKIDEFFSQSSILVNTSMVEGFPNTFLQAWIHYSPVVSLSVDPDDIIKRNDLGFCSQTVENMRSDVEMLIYNEKLRRRMGENGRRYVEKEHDIRKIAKNYLNICEEVAKN